jgi:hypothetical protein
MPGTWEVGGPYPGVSVVVMVDGGTGWPDPTPPVYEPVCIIDSRTDGEPDEMALADAHLIVAAKNLYRELESLVSRVRQAADGGDPASVVETGAAEELLKKARGETP